MADEASGFSPEPGPALDLGPLPEAPAGMRVYVAGPMRGYPEFNFPAFLDAAKRLRKAGHSVFCPAERDLQVGFRPLGMSGTDADMDGAGFDLCAALGADLAWITASADAVIVLPGWEQSAGAQAEVATARALSLPVQALEAFLNGEPADPTAPDALGLTARSASGSPEPSPPSPLAPGGRFEDISFFGHLDHTGYVTEAIDHGGNAVYRIDLPEKIWGGNPLAEIEYAASAKFSRKPVTEESVRAQWEAERARAERWRQQQAEWDRAGSQRALPAVDMSASLTGERPCLCGPDEQCDECVPF